MTLQELIDAGWFPADTPPNNDRIVQVAWDDGSTGESALCFYDSKSTIPQENERYWWSHPHIQILPPGHILAWREVQR
jgi:hypothetical protein